MSREEYFFCEMCGAETLKDWSDERFFREAKRRGIPIIDVIYICDVCHESLERNGQADFDGERLVRTGTRRSNKS
jgi:hypothetical protein